MKLKLMIAVMVGLLGLQVQAAEIPLVDKNKHEGQQFLEQNAKNKKVVTLPDGLQYKIIKQGKGPKPAKEDVVKVNYEGRFIDGTEFDSSAKHGGPIEFPLQGVIAGWTEAVQLMPVGSTWEIYVPSDLAYGDQNAPDDIGPGKTLVFKITLLEIKKNS